MLEVGAVCVLNAKIVNHQCEGYVASIVVEETVSMEALLVPVLE